MKRLVFCVEGVGDVAAVPGLIGRILPSLPSPLDAALFADAKAMKVGNVTSLSGKRHQSDWLRHLRNAQKSRPNLGAVLLLLDWDDDVFEGKRCCAPDAARQLADRARQTGAGTIFSLGVVLVKKEFESLMIASYSSLPGYRPTVTPPPDPETAPRGAKRWLSDNLDGLAGGYKENRDQAPLTGKLDFDLLRAASNRSFARLEHAVSQLAEAVHSGQHVSTPV